MISKINLEKKIHDFEGKPWSPIDITRINDQIVRMVLVEGEFHWHKHSNEDELFYVLKGEIIIQLKDQSDVNLKKGEMVVIPKGIQHCPKSSEPSYVVLFEPSVLNTKGD